MEEQHASTEEQRSLSLAVVIKMHESPRLNSRRREIKTTSRASVAGKTRLSYSPVSVAELAGEQYSDKRQLTGDVS